MGIFERLKTNIKEAGQALVIKTPTITSNLLNEDSNGFVESLKRYERAYLRVPLITSIVYVTSNFVVQDFYFVGPNKDKLTKFADKVNLSNFFHTMTKSMLIYGNAYCEVIKNGNNQIIQLKPLDSKWIQVFRNPTGDIIGYAQIIEGTDAVIWGSTGDQRKDLAFHKRLKLKNQIIHFKHNVLGSNKYGTSLIQPLMSSLGSKLDMEENLKKVLFKYVAPLIVATVGNDSFPANESVVSGISATLKDLQAESELTVSHLVDLKVLDFNAKGMDIQTPINQIEQQIITGGQVPPALLGLMGGKVDKATAEVSLRGFGRRVNFIQRELKNEFEDKFINELNLGTDKDDLIWTKTDGREWEIDIDILRGLVTDGILSPQKANDLLPPQMQETLPDIPDPLNGNDVGPDGVQVPRNNQMKSDKVKDNKNDPTQTTKNKKTMGKRVNKTDRAEKEK